VPANAHLAMYFMQMSPEMQVIFLCFQPYCSLRFVCFNCYFLFPCPPRSPHLSIVQARAWKGGVLPQNLRKRCK
jgi:hypothetical protein